MKFDPLLTDEGSIAPASPGAALVRLSQALGALRPGSNANSVPDTLEPQCWVEALEERRSVLLLSLEEQEGVAEAFAAARVSLARLWTQASSLQPDPIEQARLLEALGFPHPNRTVDTWVSAVDVSTVVASHFKPERQVLSTLAFDEAHGATAYWLNEIRFFGDQRVEEAVVENYAPQFPRLRLPVGNHRFFIESRNTHRSVRSQEFEIEVPAL